MRKILLCLSILGSFCICNAQDNRTIVALMPFVSSIPQNKTSASTLQEIVVECLRAKSNIQLVDRSKDSLLVKELDNQIREYSMDSKTLAQQGQLAGAQKILVGTLSNASTELVKTTSVLGVPTTKYTGNVSFSLQIMDAATGVVDYHKDFTGTTKKNDAAGTILKTKKIGQAGSLLMADTKEEAIVNAIKATRQDIQEWINEIYPIPAKVLSIDTKDKKGLPATVAVSGLSPEIKKGTTIIVNEVSYLDDGSGKKLKRTKKVFELKVLENQGDITECSVSSGADAVEEKVNNKANLEFIIN